MATHKLKTLRFVFNEFGTINILIFFFLSKKKKKEREKKKEELIKMYGQTVGRAHFPHPENMLTIFAI